MFSSLMLLLGLLTGPGGRNVLAAGPLVGPGYRSWELSVPVAGQAGFTLLSATETGVFFTNSLAVERSVTNHVLLNGSGVAAGDVDGDGLVDIYFCGLDGPNKLYRNLGNWRFQDITEQAGVACPGLDATGAVFADIDGDGDLDLLVNSIAGGTSVFLNDGKGRFHLSAKSPRLNGSNAGTSLALADMDGDGLLDLYIANYRPMFFFLDKPETRYSFRPVNGQPTLTMIDGRPLTDPEFTNRFVFQIHTANGKLTFGKEELGEVDVLYHNDGNGGFSPISFTGGAFLDEDGKPLTQPPRDWGLSVVFRDLNEDGFPDIYVCNDFRTPDRIWLNDGHGHFRALPRLAIRQTCLSAMGMDVADINRDGHFDLFVVDMLSVDHTRRMTQRIDLRPEVLLPGQIDNRPQFSRNMLQLGRGDGTFAEIAQFSGLEAGEWAWSPIFLDVDLDGYEDVLISNGFERDTMNMDAQNQIETQARQQKLGPREKIGLRRLYPRLNTPNLAFRNLGNCRFEDKSTEWGFDTPAISQGTCLADLDNDGDLDVIVSNMNGPAGLYRNNTTAPRIAVRLRGLPPNTRGIGAKIEVLGGPVYQSQEMVCGGRYCSGDDAMRTFAVGALTNQLKILVTWRSGRQSLVETVVPNRLYEIDEQGAGQKPTIPRKPVYDRNGEEDRANLGQKAWFQDLSALLDHLHHEELFDDFTQQPLLPVKLSQLGPAVCWFDLDQDGWEDLIIGTGRGGLLAFYPNKQGQLDRTRVQLLDKPAAFDETGILGWRRNPGSPEVLVGISNYEGRSSTTPSVRSLKLSPPSGTASDQLSQRLSSLTNAIDLVPGVPSSVGPLALGDVDGDGALDLFIGGRVIPGRYPEAASSRLFRSRAGALELDANNTAALEKVGLVSGAVFADLNGDGEPDLVLACEWGPIRVFKNQHGRLVEATQTLGLDHFTGWWNGVNVGDFDGDGKLDIVASNWGRNSRYEHFRHHPLRLYYGDFNGDGGIQTVEAYFDGKMGKTVPWRRLDDLAKAMPFLSARFDRFEALGKASVEELLGDRLPQASVLEANWLESTVFLNRGDHFDPVVLPFEAQLAPAFAVCVGDLDGDGNEDLFLSQNFFAVPAETSRYDAGRGLLLRGDGKGQFQAVSGQESGLLIYGEQRGAALCDYDHDGRLDLVVTQNAGPTKLFRNQHARPGLRIKLNGPPGNPDGIGASLRISDARRQRPMREVHAGSGYWSQDSSVQVIAESEAPMQLEVCWPWRGPVRSTLPAGVHSIAVDQNGSITSSTP